MKPVKLFTTGEYELGMILYVPTNRGMEYGKVTSKKPLDGQFEYEVTADGSITVPPTDYFRCRPDCKIKGQIHRVPLDCVVGEPALTQEQAEEIGRVVNTEPLENRIAALESSVLNLCAVIESLRKKLDQGR